MKNHIRKISCILLSLLIVLSGCGLIPSDQTSTTADPIVKHDLYFDIDFDGNIFLDKYGLDLYINDSKIKSLSNGEDLAEKQTLTEGTYTVKFVSDKDPNINIEKTVKLYTDVVFKCWLKTHSDYIECNDLSISGQDVVNKKAAETEAVETAKTCTFTLNAKSYTNLIFSKYDINVFMDGEKIGSMENGETKTFTATKNAGEHVLRFESAEDANVFGECYIYFDGNASANISVYSHSEKISIEDYVVNGAGQVISSMSEMPDKIIPSVDDETTAEESSLVTPTETITQEDTAATETQPISIEDQTPEDTNEAQETINDTTENPSTTEEQTTVEPKTTEEPTTESLSGRDAYGREIVMYGNYDGDPIEWIVLESDGNTSLLISKYILDIKAYNDPIVAQARTWEWSSLRKWLNNDFLIEAFSQEEQAAIQIINVQDYFGRSTPADITQDKVFLLSYEQAWHYFPTNSERAAKTKQSKSYSWWLINDAQVSTYRINLYKMLVAKNGEDGYIRLNEKGGVRPCIRVLSSALEIATVVSDNSSTVISVPEISEPAIQPTTSVNPERGGYSEKMVWIPTNGGTKYHASASCSNMIDPILVTEEEAIAKGFGPCGRCHP